MSANISTWIPCLQTSEITFPPRSPDDPCCCCLVTGASARITCSQAPPPPSVWNNVYSAQGRRILKYHCLVFLSIYYCRTIRFEMEVLCKAIHASQRPPPIRRPLHQSGGCSTNQEAAPPIRRLLHRVNNMLFSGTSPVNLAGPSVDPRLLLKPAEEIICLVMNELL